MGAHEGGAIYNSGNSTAVNSTFCANIADADGNGLGGGIYNGGTGTANLGNSTVACNFAGLLGGGFYNAAGSANMKRARS